MFCEEDGGRVLWRDAQLRVVHAEVEGYPWFLRVVRGALLNGEGIPGLWPNLVALGVFVCVVTALAMARYRRTLD